MQKHTRQTSIKSFLPRPDSRGQLYTFEHDRWQDDQPGPMAPEQPHREQDDEEYENWDDLVHRCDDQASKDLAPKDAQPNQHTSLDKE